LFLFGILCSAGHDPKRRLADAAPIRACENEELTMAQTQRITPFMASVPGIDERLLRDVGLDANGNTIDEHDPRLRRLKGSAGFVERMKSLLVLRRMARLRQS
jgi:hypothetical protein